MTQQPAGRPPRNPPFWMTVVLMAAGFYNLIWGSIAIVWPRAAFGVFTTAGLPEPNYPEFWQCIGMIVGVYGVAYLLASTDPRRHWPVVFAGLLGKVLGPLGFAMALYEGRFPAAFGLNIVFNDLIWWAPFALILRDAWGAERVALRDAKRLPAVADAQRLSAALAESVDQHGRTLRQQSDEAPTLVVFLRHNGCTFCREALAELARLRPQLVQQGTQLALVHMSPQRDGLRLVARFGLEDVPRYSDPQQRLYEAFELPRASFWQLFGSWRDGLRSMFVHGHFQGRIIGDALQLPGTFLLHHGRIVKAFRNQRAGERPDYCALANAAPAEN